MDRLILSLGLCSVVMTLVSLIYLAVARLWGVRWSAKWKYYLWLVPIAGFLTPIKPQLAQQPVVILPLPAQETALVSDPSAGFTLWWAAAILWGIGFIFMCGCILFNHRRFMKRMVRIGQPPQGQALEAIDKLARAMGLTPPKVLIIPGISTPMMTGLFRPLLLLPQQEYEAPAFALILRHELTHLKRRDLWIKLLVLMTSSLHWFNPFMPWIRRAIDQACELACDEAVMSGQSLEFRKLYCSSILDTLSHRHKRLGVTLVSTGFSSSKKQLKQRLIMVFSAGQKKKRITIIAACLMGMTLLSGTLFAVGNPSALADGDEPIVDTTTVIFPGDENPPADPGDAIIVPITSVRYEATSSPLIYEKTSTVVYDVVAETTLVAHPSNALATTAAAQTITVVFAPR